MKDNVFHKKTINEKEKKIFFNNIFLFKRIFFLNKKNDKAEFLKKHLIKPELKKDNMLNINSFDIGENLPRELLIDFIEEKQIQKKNKCFFFAFGLIFLLFFWFFIIVGFSTNWFGNIFFKNIFFNSNIDNINLKADSVNNAYIVANNFLKANKNNFVLAFSKNYIFSNNYISINDVKVDKNVNINFTNDQFYQIPIIGKYYNYYSNEQMDTESLLNIKKFSKFIDIKPNSLYNHTLNKEYQYWLLKNISNDDDVLKFQKKYFESDNELAVSRIINANLVFSFVGGKIPSIDYKEITNVKTANEIKPENGNSDILSGNFSLLFNDQSEFLNNILVKINFTNSINILKFNITTNSTNFNSNTVITKYGGINDLGLFYNLNQNIDGDQITFSNNFYIKKLFDNYKSSEPILNEPILSISNLQFLLFNNVSFVFKNSSSTTINVPKIKSLITNINIINSNMINTDDSLIKSLNINIDIITFKEYKVGFMICNYTYNIQKNSVDNNKIWANKYLLLFPFIVNNNKYNFKNVSFDFDVDQSSKVNSFITFGW